MSRVGGPMSFARKLVPAALVVGSTLVAVLLGELVVRIVVNPGDFLPATIISDPALGHRIKAHATGHDALGFRNALVPDQVDVIAIGDSMTYGFGVTREDSWPSQLANLLGKPVYNMALGGYGPLQYLHLAEHEAAKLRPKLLLVGFFFGNDLIEAYRMAYDNSHWHSWRQAGAADAGNLEYLVVEQAQPKKRFGVLRDWLYQNSVLYSMVRANVLVRFAYWEQERIAKQVDQNDQMAWSDPDVPAVKTIFGPRLRLSTMDQQLRSAKEGLRITKKAFSQMMKQTGSEGAQMMVVLIPTKERVYCDIVARTSTSFPESFARLCEVEKQIKEDLIGFLMAERIPHVDVGHAMEAMVPKHVRMFPEETDGHPQAVGQNVIARTIFDAISRKLPESR